MQVKRSCAGCINREEKNTYGILNKGIKTKIYGTRARCRMGGDMGGEDLARNHLYVM